MDSQALMQQFGKAFVTADAELFAASVTDDFVWMLHNDGGVGGEVHGVDAAIAVIEWRKEHWSGVRYEDVAFVFADELVTQTFRVSGADENGRPFDARAVDLYRITDGRVASKDSYWKWQDGND